MYCLLGDVALEPIDVTEFTETQSASFAEHAVLRGKPHLQATGEGLTELSFAARLHYQVGNVASRWQALVNAKSQQQALALVWGEGSVKGHFVITDLSSTTLFTDATGNVLCREISLSLKEYIGEVGTGLLGAALQVGSNSILGSLLPSGLHNSLSAAKQAVSQGVSLYHRGKRAFDEVQNAVSIMRQFTSNPRQALGYLPQTLSGLERTVGHFANITALSPALTPLHDALGVLADFSSQTQAIYRDLNGVYQDIHTNQHNSMESWFPSLSQGVSDAAEQINNLAPSVSSMTAWIVLRNDEEVRDDTDRA